jgi:hypothetical protein
MKALRRGQRVTSTAILPGAQKHGAGKKATDTSDYKEFEHGLKFVAEFAINGYRVNSHGCVAWLRHSNWPRRAFT